MFLLEINIATRVFIGIAAMLLLFGSFLYAFISSQKRKLENQRNTQAFLEQKHEMLRDQNRLLELKVAERTEELNIQKTALQESLAELKATQQQLIHREKMASLGELTAGIAHEIQNPLNFINNFSEVTIEMFADLESELAEGNADEAKMLEAEIRQNLQKINHHGKRAASIVKGMLQHSRNNSGKREMTNLNELADECLHLGYQGLRAKDKSLNVKIITAYDTNLPNIPLIPQDIGRVIINLVTNAIYSVGQKKNMVKSEAYQPTVCLTTTARETMAILQIKDNGLGIPDKIKEKIFEPFYSTKPTGQGTGLGLSMSYEIIAAHNGTITLDAEEGAFAAFTISLPFR